MVLLVHGDARRPHSAERAGRGVIKPDVVLRVWGENDLHKPSVTLIWRVMRASGHTFVPLTVAPEYAMSPPSPPGAGESSCAEMLEDWE